MKTEKAYQVVHMTGKGAGHKWQLYAHGARMTKISADQIVVACRERYGKAMVLPAVIREI